MEIENGLKKIEKWYGAMVGLSILFAIITFILYAVSKDYIDFAVYIRGQARFWASFSLTVFFAVISVTVKKIHKYLKLVNESK